MNSQNASWSLESCDAKERPEHLREEPGRLVCRWRKPGCLALGGEAGGGSRQFTREPGPLPLHG